MPLAVVMGLVHEDWTVSVLAISSALEAWRCALYLLLLQLPQAFPLFLLALLRLQAARLGGIVVWIGLMPLAVVMGLVQEVRTASALAHSSALEVWRCAQHLVVLQVPQATPLGGIVVWIGLMPLAVVMGLVQEGWTVSVLAVSNALVGLRRAQDRHLHQPQQTIAHLLL